MPPISFSMRMKFGSPAATLRRTKSLSSIHEAIQAFDEVLASLGGEPVRVGNMPKPSRVVGDVPPKPISTHVVVDRNAHSGKLSHRPSAADQVQRSRSRAVR
jgi:hypothetical protein